MAIDGTDIGSPIPDLEMDQCSYECSIKQECEFWLFKDALCYLKSGMYILSKGGFLFPASGATSQ